jgi:hypothetical protein
VSLYARLADLPLEVDGYELEPLAVTVGAGWERVSTVVRIRGGGLVGIGEDVTYEAPDQRAQQGLGPVLRLAGRYTLDSFSALLGTFGELGAPVTRDVSAGYRRWAFESAALDLALRQAGMTLASAIGRDPAPLRFVISPNLGDPPTIDAVERWLEADAGARFKLDPTPGWDESLIAALAATAAVDCLDLKAFYTGTPVDNPPDAGLYRRVAEGFPDAVIEDAGLTPETEIVLAPHRDRLSFDSPIHSVADIRGLGFPVRHLNIKPSRFGSVRELFATYEHCRSNSIAMYSGGQFELGVGRWQIQHLAALFHPGAANDAAPAAYNLGPAPGLPGSPVEPAPSGGFSP